MSRAFFRRARLPIVLTTTILLPVALAHAQEDGPGTKPRLAQPLQEGVEVRLRTGTEGGAFDPTGIDESALRYHASRGDRASVEAEIARLRAAHPGWEPPSDLYTAPSGVDEQPLWRLYDAGDYAGVRAAIARLEDEHPQWKVPEKLVTLLRENEVRAELQSLEQAKAWQRLLELAAHHPDQVTCVKIDNLWRVAEAQAALRQHDELYETYAGIIKECANLDHRVATLQKSSGHLKRQELESLFELEEQHDKSEKEVKRLAKLRVDLTGPKTPAPIERLFARNASLEQARGAEAAVLSAGHAAGAERLGWIYFDAGRWSSACKWFRHAHAWKPTAKTAEGLARAQAKLGEYEEVEALAQAWPKSVGPLLESVRMERIVRAYEAGDHRTLLAQTATLPAPAAANMRGWTYLQLDRPTESALTFERILNDEAARLAERHEAAFGLARARLAADDLEAALLVVRLHPMNPEQTQELRIEVLARQAAAAFQRKDYQTCLALLEERRGLMEPSRALLIQEAWTRYHLRQRRIAQRMFTQLDRVYSTPETREGMRVVEGSMNGF
jgi:cellulose synthase operon protein C